MLIKLNYFILILLGSISWTLYGQSQDITTLSTSDGLSENVVFDVLKDKEGFMWFATRNGLNRYDGYTFKTYRPNPFDSLSISGNSTLKIFEDSKGRLWIGTFRTGLNCFDKKTGRFYRFNVGEKGAFNQPFIFSINEDKDGTIWIGGWQATLLSIQTGEHDFDFKVTKHKVEGLDKSITFTSISVLSDSTLIVGTNLKGIFQWNKSTQRFDPFELPVSKTIKSIFALLEHPKGTLWIGTNHQMYRLKNGQMDAVPTPPEVQKKTIKYEDRMSIKVNPRNNKLWLSYYTNAVYELDPTSEALDVERVVDLNKNIDVIKIYFDENKIAWIATSGQGILKIKQQHAFKHLAKGKYVHFIYQTKKGELFIHSDRKMLVAPNRNADFMPLTEYSNIPTDFILGINETKNGALWATTRWFRRKLQPSKLFKLGTDRQVKKVLPLPPVDVIYGKMLDDSNGDLWFLSLEKDLTKLHAKTDEFEVFDCLGMKRTGIEFESKTNFYKDGQGNYWVAGMLDGLHRFTMNDGKIIGCKLYQNNPSTKKGLNFNMLCGMVDDPIEPEKYLWIATRGGGLNKLNKITETFEYFGEKDGLASNIVLGILSDRMGSLWLSTNKGLSRFNPTTQQITNFTVTNGLQGNEFSVGSCFKNEATGELFFGGINGITAFHPKDIQLSTFQPKVYISQLKIHGELIEFGKLLQQRGKNPLTQPIEFTEKIRLPWYQNQIALNFASLDFANSDKNLYQYKLSSVDKNWVNAGNRHSVSYTNLSTGTYTFRLKGTNSDGVWSSNEAVLKIVIYPPWYRTYWAYAVYFILLVFGIYKLYEDQVRRAKLRNELEYEQKEAARLAEMDKIKTNFFSNITHEFRTPLTLIIEPLRQALGYGNIASQVKKKIQLAERNSQRLLGLVNQLLDLSKLEGKKMNLELKRGNFLKFVAPIMVSFEALANKKNIQFIYNSLDELPLFDFDKNKVEKVLFNLISNAIKFTKAEGTIAVNIIENKAEKTVNIQVIDTGIGIPEKEQPHIFDRFYQVDGSNTREHEGTGIGLALSKELTEVMNGELTFESILGKGTTFEFAIPMVQMNVSEVVNTIEEPTLALNNVMELAAFTPIISDPIHISPDATNVALIIEDNEELRAFIKSSIEHKYQVIEAGNGKEGLDLALEHIPNIVISDVMMPMMDGFEVCQRLKTNEKTAHIPVILLTAKTAMDSVITGLKYGADAYMKKPFNTEELLLRMRNLIIVRQELQQKFSQVIEKVVEKNIEPTKINKEKIEITDANLSSFDQSFLNNLYDIVQKHLDDETFTVELLIKKIGTSKTQLHRKMKALLNQSPTQFIRNIRLKTAYELLQQQKGNVTEVAFMVGFSNSKYFSTKFKEKYGMSPSKV